MRNSFAFTASIILAGLSAMSAFSASSALADNGLEPPMDLLATELRDQGFACDKPDKAEMDQKASKPNETVWIVECKGVNYQMTVVPDLAAKIKKLDN